MEKQERRGKSANLKAAAARLTKTKKMMQDSQEAVTNFHWQYIKKIVDDGHKRKTCLRMVVNALLLMTRPGTQWKNRDSKYRAERPTIQY